MDVSLLLRTLFKLYATLLIGFAAARAGILDEAVNRKLSSLVINVTYPMMLLSSMLGQPGSRTDALRLLGIGFVLYIALILGGRALAFLCRVPAEKRVQFECLIVFGNTGFIGAPLAQSLYGDAAFYEMTLLNFAYYCFYCTYAPRSLGRTGDERAPFSVRSLMTPGFLFTVLAIVLYMAHTDAPSVVKETLYMSGSMTTPLSMMVLGASLASHPFRESISDRLTYVYAAVKLILVPAAVFAICVLVRMDGYHANLTVLSAALPAGSFLLMLALRMHLDSTFISRCIFVSTVLSAVTLPLAGILFLR